MPNENSSPRPVATEPVISVAVVDRRAILALNAKQDGKRVSFDYYFRPSRFRPWLPAGWASEMSNPRRLHVAVIRVEKGVFIKTGREPGRVIKLSPSERAAGKKEMWYLTGTYQTRHRVPRTVEKSFLLKLMREVRTEEALNA